LIHNVALRVEEGDSPEKFKVSGRGELHLSVLIESMRREGFEMAISKPQVVVKEINGEMQEPYEQVVIDIDEENQGSIMEEMGARRDKMTNMVPDDKGSVRLEFISQDGGLIGFRVLFMILPSGNGILTNVFDHYGPLQTALDSSRHNGVLVSMVDGKALG